MSKWKFKPEHEVVLNQMMNGNPAAIPGKMFSYPAYKVNGKLALALHDNGIVAKVGAERAKALIGKKGIEPFEPMPGRAWKDWVLLTDHFETYRDIFEEAVQYVVNETE